MSHTVKAHKWIDGGVVGQYKAAIRQVDLQNCMDILMSSDIPWDTMQAVGKQIQSNAWYVSELLKYVKNNKVSPDKDVRDACKQFIDEYDAFKDLTVSKDNLLSCGDFTRHLADFLDASAQIMTLSDSAVYDFGNWKPLLSALNTIRASLQNKQAFDKQTNRIRINRWQLLNGLPSLGIAHWRLPADDVLGCIDRLLGHYETADISGSTTDGVFAYCFLSKFCGTNGIIDNPVEITVKDFEGELNTFLTAGKGLLVLAPMVVQLHHSLPECMMAMNLTPDCARKVSGHGTPLIYSAFLDNEDYTDAKYITYTKAWREARSKVLGYVPNSSHTSPRARSLIMLQDIYQMSNRPSDANEIGLIVEYTFSDNSHPSSREFGSSFYNSVVGQLNGFWRGPGMPLEQLSKILKPIFKDLDLVDMPPATGTIGKKIIKEFKPLKNNYPKDLGDLWDRFGYLPTALDEVQKVIVDPNFP